MFFLFGLDKGLRKDKKKISRMIFSLHNLPMVYLSKNANILCLLGQNGNTPEDAFAYSKFSMDEDMLSSYRHFKKQSYETFSNIDGWKETGNS